tara:strand:+ start:1572 stop:2129 length:558 start_codon:yes stop_codon:yes gene_type:complete
MRNKHVWDAVNNVWPKDVNLVPTEREAVIGVKRLYKKFMGHAWSGEIKITSGNRHTWIRRNTLSINPDHGYYGGWRDIVHGLSHYIFMRQNPNLKPHNPKQAYLERAIAEYVVASGFLEGRHVRPLKEKPKISFKEKPKISLVEKRSNHAKDMLKKHQDNLKRTAKLVTKWQKKVRYYEKRNAPS